MPRLVAGSITLLFLSALAVSAATGRTAQMTLHLYLALSLLTFAWYAKDKYAARRGGRRTPEKRLHLLALVGGWPGALVAQQLLRHKTRKPAFRITFWTTVALHCCVLVYLHSPQGADMLRHINAWSW